MARDKQAEEIEQLAAEVDALAPYLDLAREIRREVERFTDDDDAGIESLTAALDSIPARERAEMAKGVFARLSPEQQFSVLERLFGDEELRAVLEDERSRRLAELRRSTERRSLARRAVRDGRLDLRELPEGTELTIGLFRPADVRVAIGRGRLSDACARLLILRATTEPGTLRVIDDVFNPRGGFFVSAAYDQTVWQTERLDSHTPVRPGSKVDDALEPSIYLGARLDVEVGGAVREGRLHVGYVLLDDQDAFATQT